MLLADQELALLVEQSGLVQKEKLQDVLEFVKNSHTPLGDALIEKDVLSDEMLGQVVANFFKIPFVILSKVSIPDDVFLLIPERVARKQKVIAFAKDQQGIKVAMANPANKELLQMLTKKTGENIIVNLATERDIYNTLQIYRRDFQKTFDRLLQDTHAVGPNPLEHAPITKIVDMIIDYAYQDKASDIHIEPEEENSLIRFRIDGILHDVSFIPKALHDQIVSRIKVLSRLRTDEHLSPQDGKMRIKLEEENLDIRVSIIPIVEGEKVVMRLLASHFRQFSLIDLGMSEKDLQKLTLAYKKSFGMILSTGPTGSGKTTSIYAILKILNTRDKNITTIEDPVEYRVKGVNQIHVNTKTNLTFASGLRSILRQDPNIIFVGEIRDSETAGIAVNAALTGHLVLSTLHTNDAATALPRFVDMNIEPFLVASTVNIIIAQRLVRKICETCRMMVTIPMEDVTKNIPINMIQKYFSGTQTITTYQGKGCKACHNTGYLGRVGVFEVLEVTKEIRKLIVERRDADIISNYAQRLGMTTMLDDGLEKIAKGITTLEEVLRVTKIESL